MNKFIQAKFKGICHETGKTIAKGDSILYNTDTKKAYSSESSMYKKAYECTQDAYYVQAQEDAYFDNFCQRNGI